MDNDDLVLGSSKEGARSLNVAGPILLGRWRILHSTGFHVMSDIILRYGMIR